MRLNGKGATAAAAATPDGFRTFDLIAALKPSDHVTARAGLFDLADRRCSRWNDMRGLTSTSIIRTSIRNPSAMSASR